MAWIEGTESRDYTIAAPIAAVEAWFSDPGRFREAYLQLEKAEEVETGVWRWVLREKTEKGVTFQADYTVRYTPEEGGARWETLKGNLRSSGKVRCEAIGEARTRVRYEETIAVDLPVPKLAAKLFGPIVAREIRGGVREFLDVSQQCLERA